VAQNAFDRRAERGPAGFDRPHRATVTMLYTTPFKGGDTAATKALRYIAGNWTLAGTLQIQSGAPDTFYINGIDQNRDRRATNDRPSLSNPDVAINYSDACVYSSTCITGVGRVRADGSIRDFNTGVPGTASDFRYLILASGNGNVGRNTFRNDWSQDWDITATRIFPIPGHEKHQLEFRGDVANPFNHPNPGLVSTDLNSAAFMNSDLARTGGRSMYLWVKYRF
jgi:hypothetical protein